MDERSYPIWKAFVSRPIRSHTVISRLACLVIAFLALPTFADTDWKSRNGHYTVSYESEIDPIIINRMHRWWLEISDRDGNAVTGAEISIDGGMPAHDHGLPTRPLVTNEIEPGRYQLEGLRFHMTGEWEIVLTIDAGNLSDVTIIRLEL